MAGVKANWHLEQLTADLADPFDAPAVEEIGQPISLEDPPTLRRQLVDLLTREHQLAAAGVTCAIKDRPDTTCSACPVRRVSPLDEMTALCGVGCAQERTMTTLAVANASHRPA